MFTKNNGKQRDGIIREGGECIKRGTELVKVRNEVEGDRDQSCADGGSEDCGGEGGLFGYREE